MSDAQRTKTQDHDTDELANLLGYQLHLTNMITLREARAALEDRQLTPAKVTALLFIRDHAGSPQSALARFLSINRSSAMKLVDILAANHFIKRDEGKDRRSHGLYLTARGTAVLKAAVEALQEEDQMLSSGLNANERRELLRLLKKLRAGIASDQFQITTVGRKVS